MGILSTGIVAFTEIPWEGSAVLNYFYLFLCVFELSMCVFELSTLKSCTCYVLQCIDYTLRFIIVFYNLNY